FRAASRSAGYHRPRQISTTAVNDLRYGMWCDSRYTGDRNARVSRGAVEMFELAMLPSESRTGTKYHHFTISAAADRSSTHADSVATSSRRHRRATFASVAWTRRAPADALSSRRAATESSPTANSMKRNIVAGATEAWAPNRSQSRTDSFAKSVRPSVKLK